MQQNADFVTVVVVTVLRNGPGLLAAAVWIWRTVARMG